VLCSWRLVTATAVTHVPVVTVVTAITVVTVVTAVTVVTKDNVAPNPRPNPAWLPPAPACPPGRWGVSARTLGRLADLLVDEGLLGEWDTEDVAKIEKAFDEWDA